jgi:hypothetical protein
MAPRRTAEAQQDEEQVGELPAPLHGVPGRRSAVAGLLAAGLGHRRRAALLPCVGLREEAAWGAVGHPCLHLRCRRSGPAAGARPVPSLPLPVPTVLRLSLLLQICPLCINELDDTEKAWLPCSCGWVQLLQWRRRPPPLCPHCGSAGSGAALTARLQLWSARPSPLWCSTQPPVVTGRLQMRAKPIQCAPWPPD